jgi:hypothetical protein
LKTSISTSIFTYLKVLFLLLGSFIIAGNFWFMPLMLHLVIAMFYVLWNCPNLIANIFNHCIRLINSFGFSSIVISSQYNTTVLQGKVAEGINELSKLEPPSLITRGHKEDLQAT